jgi:hypothetical protein
MHRDVFPPFGNYERKGWIISPALTYTLRPLKNNQEILEVNDSQRYDIAYRAAGKMGLGMEVGRFYVMDNSPLISYVDISLGIKSFRGVERFEATLDDPTRVNPIVLRGDGNFGQTWATASFNAYRIHQLSDYSFIQNGIGLNADYQFARNIRYNDRGLPMELQNPGPFIFQAHYKFGFGMKVSPSKLIIPSIETPILTLHEWDNFQSTLLVFNSRYRPIIVRITVMMLDAKKGRECPGKNNRKGKSNRSETLFGMLDAPIPW